MKGALYLFAIFAFVAFGFVKQATAEPIRLQSISFACQHFKSAGQMKKGRTKADMRIQVSGDPQTINSSWQIEIPGQGLISAKPFDAQFGMHGSLGLSWIDAAGKSKRAFIAFGESHDDAVFFWLNFGKPSTFFPPGYGCDNDVQISSEKTK